MFRDRSLITSRGGRAVVLEGGGYNYKTSPSLGGKFFTGKKHEGGQILWHSNSRLGNLTSVIYPRFPLQVYVYQISKSKNDKNFIHRHKQLNFNILNNVKWDKLTSKPGFEPGLEPGLQLGLFNFFVSQKNNKQIINTSQIRFCLQTNTSQLPVFELVRYPYFSTLGESTEQIQKRIFETLKRFHLTSR